MASSVLSGFVVKGYWVGIENFRRLPATASANKRFDLRLISADGRKWREVFLPASYLKVAIFNISFRLSGSSVTAIKSRRLHTIV